MIALLQESIANLPSSPGFLLDGFPATMVQAKIFVEKVQAPHKIIVLDVPEDVMRQRLKDGVNFDDQDDTIKKRVLTFLGTTKPFIQALGRKWPQLLKTVSLSLYWSLS